MCVITCLSVFNVWPKAALLLPGWPRDATRVDTPALEPASLGLNLSSVSWLCDLREVA